MPHKLTKKKAKTILTDKEVRGKSLTERQRKFFAAVAFGNKPIRLRG